MARPEKSGLDPHVSRSRGKRLTTRPPRRLAAGDEKQWAVNKQLRPGRVDETREQLDKTSLGRVQYTSVANGPRFSRGEGPKYAWLPHELQCSSVCERRQNPIAKMYVNYVFIHLNSRCSLSGLLVTIPAVRSSGANWTVM